MVIGRSSFVGQVTVVAILMLIHGVLGLFVGGGYVAMGTVFPEIFKESLKQQQQMQDEMPLGQKRQADAMFKNVGTFVAIYYIGAGVVALVAAVLQIWAGVVGLGYRGRTAILQLADLCSV